MTDPLANANRRALLAIIHARPGLSFRALVQVSGLGSGTVRHHLTVMERHGLVWTLRVGSQLAHFGGSRPASADRRLAALAACCDPLDRALLDVVATQPVRGQRAFFEAAPATPRSSVMHRIQRLVTRGLLLRRDQGRWACYALAWQEQPWAAMATPQGVAA